MSSTEQKYAGIVVLNYNNAFLSNALLDSIKTAKTLTRYKIFLIDNNSTNEDLDLLSYHFESLRDQSPFNFDTFLKNSANLGFSAANNQGIQHFLKDPNCSHIVLLNNDTLVTDCWLDDLIAHSAETTVVGPVSNSVGNEQRIPVTYELDPKDLKSTGSSKIINKVLTFASKRKMKLRSELFATNQLGFFCICFPSLVFKKVGLIDENFGLGYFEDDDLCIRCNNLDIPLKIARDVFVHHWGSASFGQIPEKSRELFIKNQAYLHKKHGDTIDRHYCPTPELTSLLQEILSTNNPDHVFTAEQLSAHQSLIFQRLDMESVHVRWSLPKGLCLFIQKKLCYSRTTWVRRLGYFLQRISST